MKNRSCHWYKKSLFPHQFPAVVSRKMLFGPEQHRQAIVCCLQSPEVIDPILAALLGIFQYENGTDVHLGKVYGIENTVGTLVNHDFFSTWIVLSWFAVHIFLWRPMLNYIHGMMFVDMFISHKLEWCIMNGPHFIKIWRGIHTVDFLQWCCREEGSCDITRRISTSHKGIHRF